ncbi:MAG TPA: BrnA antitoxin family protein [Acetobacteraceae bacterium]|nr:BrnA antitoxin family protein [Acetobacteraceae bacterium]
MKRKGNIVRASAEEISRMLAEGGDGTDWARVHAMSQEEVERLADEADGPLPDGWESTIEVGIPGRKDVRIPLDADVLDWFRARGPDYLTRINAVLRAFMEARQAEEAGAADGL